MSKDNGTYIKLFRKITDWEWYTDIPTCKLFIHILLKASVTGKRYRGQDIPMGAFTTSIEILASETGLSPQNVRTALKKLKSTGEITCQVTNKFTQIMVIKWGDYQSYVDVTNKQNNKQVTINQQSTNNQLTTIKEYKEYKECKEYKNNNILAPSYDSSDAVEKLITLKPNEFYYIHTKDIEKYKGYYPAVDVEQELKSMSAWLDANPKNRKTHNGMPRFINNWLAKTQNRTRAYSKKQSPSDLLYTYEIKE